MHTAIQWNARSISNKKFELTFFCQKYSPIVFAIAETWLKPQSPFNFPGYIALRDDRVDGWDGAALIIKRNIPFVNIQIPPHSSNLFIVAANIFNIAFISIYIPHPSLGVLSELNAILKNIPKPMIILGDLNCHDTSWGSAISDNNGRKLLSIFDELNLCCLNDGRPTRRTAPNHNVSAVDVSVCSTDLASEIQWNISTNSHNSDHFPIIITLPQSCRPPASLPPLQKYRLSKADWGCYSSSLDNKVEKLLSEHDISLQVAYTRFVEIIHEAAKEAVPLKADRRRVPSQPWWDADCSAAVKDRNLAEKKYISDINIENYISFKKARAKCRKLLSLKKMNGWNAFCESVSPSTAPSTVWQNIRNFRKGMSPPSGHASTLAWTEDFLNKLAPPTVPSPNDIPTLYHFSQSDHFLSRKFDLEELEAVFSSLSDSAPSGDGIVYSFLKKAGTRCHNFFLNLVNKIFETGDIPKTWKHQIIIPILKPGKDPEDHNSHRPIALSSVMCKVVEHLLKNRLEWFAENSDALSTTQFGFRKGKSVTDSHALLSTDVRLALTQNQSVIATFLDISAAYDNVLLSVLSSKLRQMSVPEKVVLFINNIISGREISLRLPNYQGSSRLAWKGLPQGSVLSPLLYNIYTSDLDQAINQHCNVLQYADDIAIYTQNKNIDQAARFINRALASLGLWLDAHGLDLSPSKCVAVVFSRQGTVNPVNIKYRSQQISVKDKAKFLGVVFDSKLSGSEHINYVVGKCEKNINILRCLSGAWWGAHPYSQKLLYNALVRSHLDFGSIILEPCCKENLKRLDQVQSKALRIVTGAMKSSPIKALQVECSEPPLNIRRQYLADRYIFRIAQLDNHPLIPKLELLQNHTEVNVFWRRKAKPNTLISYNRLNNINAPIAKFPKLPIYVVPFQTLTFQPKVVKIGIQRSSSAANDKFVSAIREKWQDWDLIFTDASKLNKEDPVGCAFIHDRLRSTHQFQLPSIASIFTGECSAILNAIKYIREHRLGKTIIFSDSLSAIQAISCNSIKNCARSAIICLVKEALLSCHLLNLEVKISWIPSHKGINGNEVVDKAAKEAASGGSHSVHQCYSNDLAAISTLTLFNTWSNEWNTNNKLQFYKIQKTIPRRPWFFKFKFKKKITSCLIRLRLGHVCSPEFLHKIKIKDDPLCGCRKDIGSIDHIFFNCPHNNFDMYEELVKSKTELPTNARTLLANFNESVISVLAKFIDKNDIKL